MQSETLADLELIQSADPVLAEENALKETAKAKQESAPAEDDAEHGQSDAEQSDNETPETQQEDTEEPQGEGNDQEVEAQAEEVKQRKSRAKERIHQLSEEKRQKEAELSEALNRVRYLEGKLRQQPDVDPEDFEAQQSQKTLRTLQEDQYNDAVQTAKQINQQRAQTTVNTLQAKCDAASDRFPGVFDKISTLPTLSYATLELVSDSPQAAEIANFLAANPTEAATLARKSDAQLGLAIARLENRFSSAKPKRVSDAPKPPPKVTPTSGRGKRSFSEMNFAEYEKSRKAGG
ncbi:MAG: hypothetical protein RIC14_00100 [Filomicrobium sp.]